MCVYRAPYRGFGECKYGVFLREYEQETKLHMSSFEKFRIWVCSTSVKTRSPRKSEFSICLMPGSGPIVCYERCARACFKTCMNPFGTKKVLLKALALSVWLPSGGRAPGSLSGFTVFRFEGSRYRFWTV